MQAYVNEGSKEALAVWHKRSDSTVKYFVYTLQSVGRIKWQAPPQTLTKIKHVLSVPVPLDQ